MPVGPVSVPEDLLHLFGDGNPNDVLNLPPFDYKKWLKQQTLSYDETSALRSLRRTATRRQNSHVRSEKKKNDMEKLIRENNRLCHENNKLRAENAELRAAVGTSTSERHPWNVDPTRMV